MSPLSRRHFLHLAGAGAASLAATPRLHAIEPFARTGAPAMRLSLAAYSLRNFFKDSSSKQTPVEGPKIDVPQFIDYCGEHRVGAELTSYFFPKDVTPEYLRDVRRHAFLRGVPITGSAIGNNFALPPGDELKFQIAFAKKWIDYAALLGAPHIRVFAGQSKDADAATARKQCISALEECCDYAGKAGIFLGLENHNGIVAKPEELLEIVKAVRSPWFGVNLDTGNFFVPDPYAALAQCAPYAVNVQVKVDMKPDGKKPERADLPRVIQILRDAHYQGWVALEYESGAEPHAAIPKHLETLAQLLDSPSSAAPAKATSEARSLFNGSTLAGWKPTEFGGAGEVRVESGQIILDAGNDLTGVNYTGEMPKMSYELSLVAQRVQGGDFFCGLTLPVGEQCITWVVGGWGGSVVGISSIDNEDASENETTQFVKFVQGQWYRLRIRVTPEKIEAWIDDEQQVNLVTKDKKLGMRLGEIEMSMPIGIATFRTTAALKEIKLRQL